MFLKPLVKHTIYKECENVKVGTGFAELIGNALGLPDMCITTMRSTKSKSWCTLDTCQIVTFTRSL